ncbi:hypothetical conserved protein [Rhizobium etli CFN 42]|uniref:Hypothetical conserved protein n=1 Tax=Rhizobium etli (strain ATCC 51251 / DSM 11541 / JCM 21823 / NBRC 15573 / CFN 42) TaxID=347834 RepID=Q2K8P4_RHIEC|nr:hypothetical protein [Rhizobium etli]ABC90792.1 hypothetical conserved protein [Rhizobium etli CFN 42]
MPESPSFTFYTYSLVNDPCDDRWAYTGIPGIFFDDAESARHDLLELRRDVESEPGCKWSPMRLEKIETLPISKASILALLNSDLGSFVKSYEVIDVID